MKIQSILETTHAKEMPVLDMLLDAGMPDHKARDYNMLVSLLDEKFNLNATMTEAESGWQVVIRMNLPITGNLDKLIRDIMLFIHASTGQFPDTSVIINANTAGPISFTSKAFNNTGEAGEGIIEIDCDKTPDITGIDKIIERTNLILMRDMEKITKGLVSLYRLHELYEIRSASENAIWERVMHDSSSVVDFQKAMIRLGKKDML